MSLLPASEMRFEAHVPIAIVGGGACGLVAALAVRGLCGIELGEARRTRGHGEIPGHRT